MGANSEKHLHTPVINCFFTSTKAVLCTLIVLCSLLLALVHGVAFVLKVYLCVFISVLFGTLYRRLSKDKHICIVCWGGTVTYILFGLLAPLLVFNEFLVAGAVLFIATLFYMPIFLVAHAEKELGMHTHDIVTLFSKTVTGSLSILVAIMLCMSLFFTGDWDVETKSKGQYVTKQGTVTYISPFDHKRPALYTGE